MGSYRISRFETKNDEKVEKISNFPFILVVLVKR